MHTIKLLHTATKGERTISELVFQKPKIKHFLALDAYPQGSLAGDIALTSALTGEPEILIGELDPEDWPKVRAYLSILADIFFGVPKAASERALREDPTTAGPETPPKEDVR